MHGEIGHTQFLPKNILTYGAGGNLDRSGVAEMFSPASLPGWDAMPANVSNIFGEKWYVERRSVALIVPSVVARVDRNVLINPAHPEFRHITTSLHEPVFWDRRLFGS